MTSILRLPVLALMALLLGALAFWLPGRSGPVLSRWAAAPAAPAEKGGIVARAEPVAVALPGDEALESYSRDSALQETVANDAVRFFRRDLPTGGTLAYFVVQLDEQVHLEVVSADGATPGSDAQGDTIWTDGQRHLASVATIANAPYAVREGMDLLGAMAFGFHGDVRTSNEGTVVVNGTILRVNPGRATLCVTASGQARIGLFDAAQLADCQQAVGAGPVILWNGKIASTSVAEETDDLVPFNPLNEDFTQLDWRKKIYNGEYPKSVIGVGNRADGRSFLVMLVSYGVPGEEIARQLRAMGCTSALGGDDDTSTQAVWRGTPVRLGNVRNVPDAVAVYVRK